jgi:DNA-binding NarL/FixJ family response regulator
VLFGGVRRLTTESLLYKALIVDDCKAFRNLLRLTLQERTECEFIAEASDGLEAIELTEQLHPDLILMDLGLPGLSGIDVGQRIRQISPNSKILFVSQESSAEIVQQVLDLGANGYLLKFDAAELLTAVDTVLRGALFVSSRLKGMVPPKIENLDFSKPSVSHSAAEPQDRVVLVARLFRVKGERLD